MFLFSSSASRGGGGKSAAAAARNRRGAGRNQPQSGSSDDICDNKPQQQLMEEEEDIHLENQKLQDEDIVKFLHELNQREEKQQQQQGSNHFRMRQTTTAQNPVESTATLATLTTTGRQRRIRSLHLTHNQLGPAGILALAKAIQQGDVLVLQTLDLYDNLIGECCSTTTTTAGEQNGDHAETGQQETTTTTNAATAIGGLVEALMMIHGGGGASAGRAMRTPRLKRLELGHTRLGTEGIDFLVKAAIQNPRYDDGNVPPQPTMTSCCCLVELGLSKNDMGDPGVAALAQALAHTAASSNLLSCLQVLDLRDNQIGSAGATALAQALLQQYQQQQQHAAKGGSCLRWLSLEHNRIGPAGARALAETLAHMTSDDNNNNNTTGLQGLYLENNQIEWAGTVAMANALQTNCTLQTLALQNNRINTLGAHALAQALPRNRTLKILDLQQNRNMGREGAAVLFKAWKKQKQHDDIGRHAALEKLLLDHQDDHDDGATSRRTDPKMSNNDCDWTFRGAPATLDFLDMTSRRATASLDCTGFSQPPDENEGTHPKEGQSSSSSSRHKVHPPHRNCDDGGRTSFHGKNDVYHHSYTTKDGDGKNQRQQRNVLTERREGRRIDSVDSGRECWSGQQQEEDEQSAQIEAMAVAALAGSFREHFLNQPHVRFHHKGLKDEDATAIAYALTTSGANKVSTSIVETLHLPQNQIGDAGAMALARVLQTNTSLRVLNLGKNEIGSEGATAIANALALNTTLQSLDLFGNKIGETGANAFLMLLSEVNENTILETLFLGGNGISDALRRQIQNILRDRKTKRLQHEFDAPSSTTKMLASPLTPNNDTFMEYFMDQTVVEVDLNGRGLKDQDASTLADVLGTTRTTVEVLRLEKNRIGDQGCTAIADALKRNTRLMALHLAGNHVASKGAVSLAFALRINSTLQTLDLQNNMIGDRGGKALLLALKEENIALETLSLAGNRVRVDVREEIEGMLLYRRVESVLILGRQECSSKSDRREDRRRHNQLQEDKHEGKEASARPPTPPTQSATPPTQETENRERKTPRHVNLNGRDLDDQQAEAVAGLLAKNSSTVETLNLGRNRIGDKGAIAIVHIFTATTTTATSLRTLHLGNNRIGTKGAIALAEAIKRISTLHTLGLRNNQICADGAIAIAGALKKNATLKKLALAVNGIGHQGAVMLAGALRINSSLQGLGLDSNHIGDQGACAIAESLGGNSSLQGLNLDQNQIGGEGATVLAMSLKSSTTLKTLTLAKNQIGAQGAIAVAEMLKVNSSLERLFIGNNHICQEGARAIADALKGNATLDTMYLEENKIGDRGARALLDTLLDGNMTLRVLCLDDTGITDALNEVIQDTLQLCEEERARMKAAREAEFEGAKIRSHDEVRLVLQALEEQERNCKEAAMASMSTQSVIELERITTKKASFQLVYFNHLIPTLDEMNLDEQLMEIKLSKIKDGFRKATRESDIAEMKRLISLRDELEMERQNSNEAFRAARLALDKRNSSLGRIDEEVAGSPRQLMDDGTPLYLRDEIQAGRSVLKEGLEATSTVPAREVPYGYLVHLTKEWHPSCEIAEGGQGRVYRGFDEELNYAVAIKRMRISVDKGKAFDKELKALSKLDHPNIVRLLAYSKTDSNKVACLVYEYASAGTMADALEGERNGLGHFGWKCRVDAFIQLVRALNYCHTKSIRHRDVKAQNVCFADESFRDVILIDFGVSTDRPRTLTSYAGTDIYMAPEYKASRKYFWEQTEMYAVGVVLLCLITAETNTESLQDLIKEAQHGHAEVIALAHGDWDHDVLCEICAIACQCLTPNPYERPHTQDILNILLPLRETFRTELSPEERSSLNRVLQESSFAGTTRTVCGRKCSCGQWADDGVACQNDHAVCRLCLESLVRRKGGEDTDLFNCPETACDEHFGVADLKDSVREEILAEYALSQQQLQETNRMKQGLEAFIMDIRPQLHELQRKLQSAFAKIDFVASTRSACPTLSVLWPIRCGRVLKRPRHHQEYRMYFLCACDLTPTSSYITVQRSRDWVRGIAPMLKYTLLACIVSSCLGVEPTLPRCIPGNSVPEKVASLIDSLSDILDLTDYYDWTHLLQQLVETGLHEDEAAFMRLICTRADQIEMEPLDLVSALAYQQGNRGWEEEMEVAHRLGRSGEEEWGWVIKKNKREWEREGCGARESFRF